MILLGGSVGLPLLLPSMSQLILVCFFAMELGLVSYFLLDVIGRSFFSKCYESPFYSLEFLQSYVALTQRI